MFVIGATTEHTIYAYSEKMFLIDEYLKIEDAINGNPLAIVTSSFRYNSLSDAPSEIRQYLVNAVKDVENFKEISVAILKVIEELVYPVLPGAILSNPSFDEIKKILIYGDVKKHLVLGTIRGTEKTFQTIEAPFNNNFMLFDGKSEKYFPQEGIPFILNQYKFREYPHIGLFGGSGSGKTHALRVLCEEFLKHRIPGVLLDPHYEMTFSEKNNHLPSEFLHDFNDSFTILTVGEDIGISFDELNSEELVTLLKFLSNISETAYSIIDAVHEKGDTFARFLNKIELLKEVFDYHDKPTRDRDTQLAPEAVMLYEKYSKKVPNTSALQAVLWRLHQLKNVGIFTKNIKKVEDALMNRQIVVVRGRDIHVKMIAEYMIKRLYQKRRSYKDWEELNKKTSKNDLIVPDKFPPFLILADEAHNYAPHEKFVTTPLAMQLVQISQEARKYGVFLVLATQRPASLHTTLFAQLNTKFIFRITTKNDIDTIKTETNLTVPQSMRLPNLTSGNAFVSSPLLNETTSIKFRATSTVSPHAENPFDELDDFEDGNALKRVLLEMLPFSDADFPVIHNEINNKMGKSVSLTEIKNKLNVLSQAMIINVDNSIFGVKYSL